MPRTRSLAWSQLKIGLVGVAAIVLAALMILAVGGQGGFFWQRYPLKARFNDVLGLKPGAVVRLSGKEVGTVTAVEFAGSQVDVSLEVSKDIRPLLTPDAVATIGSLSLLGEPIIDLTAGRGGQPLPDWGYLQVNPSKGALSDLTDTASTGLVEARKLIEDIRAGRGTLGKLVTDTRLYNDLDEFVSSATAVTRAINRGEGTLGALSKDPAAYNAMKASLQNLQVITEKINRGEGSIGKLMNDDALAKSLTATTADLQSLTAKLNRTDGTAGKLINEKELYTKLLDLTTHLDEVMAGLTTGRGTAGLFLQDRALYENMNKTVTEVRELLADIRKDPKKYLRVNVSIF